MTANLQLEQRHLIQLTACIVQIATVVNPQLRHRIGPIHLLRLLWLLLLLQQPAVVIVRRRAAVVAVIHGVEAATLQAVVA